MPVELCPPIDDMVDEADVPSVLNFLPLDALYGVMDQDPPARSGIYVTFPLQPDWQQMQEMVCSTSKATLFMAAMPSPAMSHKDMSFWHNCAMIWLQVANCRLFIYIYIDIYIYIYIYGKAGMGKTEVALHICELFKGQVQAA